MIPVSTDDSSSRVGRARERALLDKLSAKATLKTSGWFKRLETAGEADFDEEKRTERNRAASTLKGSLYRYWAFTSRKTEGKSLWQPTLWIIFLLQVFAPVAIFIHLLYSMDKDAKFWRSFRFVVGFRYEWGSTTDGVSYCSSRMLAFFMLILYGKLSLQKLKEEEQADCKIALIMARMENMKKYVLSDMWLQTGTIVICYVVTMCYVLTWMHFQLARDPSVVLFEAMTMLFLVDLGNVPGPLGIVSPSLWDAGFMGRFIYDLSAHTSSKKNKFDDAAYDVLEEGFEFDPDDELWVEAMLFHLEEKTAGATTYAMTRRLLQGFLVILPLTFFFLEVPGSAVGSSLLHDHEEE
eukprot:gnl/TRDRNA2_/TRDRNA2_127182_c0_seq1.p1 gnl/TRDRNA2_/TRDRNA2_127182_c0~~gnl/TRDRNA2_/TRDRNA2_127182_c0_seq1.p1  ORF type:complete len:352 (+),score=78.97 gnl/TRDRNA2_/TRDRNA2_127182_c0_seq1:107-1162(+)